MANNTNKIDQYLRNELPESEKKQFDRLLLNPDKSLEGKNLNDEMELQKEIIMAIQARGLKETLQLKEAEMRAKRKNKQRILRISTWSTAASLVAAVALLAVIITPMVKTMKAESFEYAKIISTSPTRGAVTNDLQMQLFTLYNQISFYQFNEASKTAKQLIQLLQNPPQNISREEAQEIYDEVQWLQTICEMNQGHVFRAKKLLQQIANSDSHYASQAQEFLEKL